MAHKRLNAKWRMLMVVAGAALAIDAHGDVIYVDDSAIGGANDGSSWADAFIDLQSALTAAQTGDEIRIGQGLYTPAAPGAPRTATFSLYAGAKVRGGYAGVGAPDPDVNDPALNVTTLSGDLNDNDDFGPEFFVSREDNSLHVVSAHALASAAHVYGVKISGGWASETEPPHYQGGGIYTTDSVLHLSQVALEHNFARVYGGGVQANAAFAESELHMQNCVIRANALPILWSFGAGGGVNAGSRSTIADCRFEFNGSSGGQDAGALYMGQGEVKRCVFIDNNAEDGGAVAGGGFVMHDCLFLANRAGYWGGAMWISGPTTLINCAFVGNDFAIEGGAIRHRGGTLNATNCLFTGNRADHGGAVSIDSHPSHPSDVTFINSTFVGNESFFLSGGGIVSNAPSLALNNCVLWANLNSEGSSSLIAQVSAAQGTLTTSHCIIQGWPQSVGDSTTGDDPLLIDADGQDNVYGTLDDNPRLSAESPARDSGDSSALPFDAHDLDGDGNFAEPLPYDLDANRRLVGRAVDRGCYEFQTCPADIAPLAEQGDGQVDLLDLLAIIDAWGPCPAPCPPDVIPNSAIDVSDLLAIILGWGECP